MMGNYYWQDRPNVILHHCLQQHASRELNQGPQVAITSQPKHIPPAPKVESSSYEETVGLLTNFSVRKFLVFFSGTIRFSDDDERENARDLMMLNRE